ncbi:hypothetical protein ACVWXQ_000376 [Bradyrhizobium sp. S3.14.4]
MMTDGILSQLKKASAAEEFFALLGVEYDEKIIQRGAASHPASHGSVSCG